MQDKTYFLTHNQHLLYTYHTSHFVKKTGKILDGMNGKKMRVKLKDQLAKTSTSIEIKGDGSLMIDFYDFSEEAENTFGNDVAYTLTVNTSDKDKVLPLLSKKDADTKNLNEDGLLLQLMQERFSSYFEIQKWFQENKIPYKKDFNSWA